MDELSAAMQEVAKLQANSVKMQSQVVQLEAELKKERDQHLATSQQLEIAQSTITNSGEQMKVRNALGCVLRLYPFFLMALV